MDRARLAVSCLPRKLLAGALLFSLVASSGAQEDEAARRLRTDSRMPYVHRITLYDVSGEAIDPRDPQAPPFSTTATCGKCHEVGLIGGGWHFNAGRADVEAGRPGEPWIWSEPLTGVQAPLSYRGWPGTFTPEQLGVSAWRFALRFGAHLPGGGMVDPPAREAEKTEEAARWAISGGLEIDCLLCHSADQTHDPAERERQIERENFRWIPTVAYGLATVRGDAKKLPDDFDPLAPPNPDFPDLAAPTLTYDLRRFDNDDRVFFNVTRHMSSTRCYFCHSFREPSASGPGASHGASTDVHLAAGMQCADCHTNGIDHMIDRGAPAPHENNTVGCRECHLGGDLLRRDATAGRLGAPYPEHKGMPPIHFDVLTCTACHSGPWPEDAPRRFQTAMNHGLGLPSRERTEHDPPTIVAPVFAPDAQGVLAPMRMLWPAYWAVVDGAVLTPLSLDHVQRAAAKLGKREKSRQGGLAPPLSDDQIAIMLTQLSGQLKDTSGAPAYVRGGLVIRLGEDGKLTRGPHEAATPTLWPLAHDVRPASQSLGVRGCTDCHAEGAPLYSGALTAKDEPAELAAQRPLQRMTELRREDLRKAEQFNQMMRLRAAFKWFAAVCAALMTVALLRGAFASAPAPVERRP